MRTTIGTETYDHADTLVLGERDGRVWCQCTDCGRQFWAHRFGPREHSKSCDTRACPVAVLPKPETEAAPVSTDLADLNRRAQVAARTGLVGKHLTDTEAVDAVNAGYLSANDAMNRDD